MIPGEFFTWERILALSIIQGRISAEELQQRTLSFTYIDNSREFDTFEWSLYNGDGLLTRPENIGVGLFLGMRLGYTDGSFPWKAFIINRMQGGVGVWGKDRPAVGENEAKITYYGRNRNAPGGRTGHRTTPKVAYPPKKKGKHYPPTLSDSSAMEMIIGQKQGPRFYKGNTTSDIVQQIALLHGFSGNYALIQETTDELLGGGYHIEADKSDGEALVDLARHMDFQFKIAGDVLHFHHRYWTGVSPQLADTLTYGASPDILKIGIDCDFQIPLPAILAAKGYNPRKRELHGMNRGYDQNSQSSNMAFSVITDFINSNGRSNTLLRNETVPIIAGSALRAEEKSIQLFIRRHTRAFQINVTTVGNPKLLADRLVKIEGTGSPFVDGIWYIWMAKHIIDKNTYVTELRLAHPPKKSSLEKKSEMHATNHGWNTHTGKLSDGHAVISGYKQIASRKDLPRNNK